MDTLNGLLSDIAALKKRVSVLETQACPRWVWTSSPGWIGGKGGAPLTSTSWDGDAFSTTAKTVIDLSAVFSVPASVKAVLCLVNIRDSGSAGTYSYLILSPNNTDGSGMITPASAVNDRYNPSSHVVPCDANGDIYYQIVASGAGTLDAVLQIWGYLM